jgi:hypothetical protein
MLTKDFFEAEFYKFVVKLNRILLSEDKEIINFSFHKSGFVDVSIFDKKNFSSEKYSFSVEK